MLPRLRKERIDGDEALVNLDVARGEATKLDLAQYRALRDAAMEER